MVALPLFNFRSGREIAANLWTARFHEVASATTTVRDEADAAYNEAVADSNTEFSDGVRFAIETAATWSLGRRLRGGGAWRGLG